ncbi:MAG: MFS transporter, partial [Sphingomonas sp.]
GRAIGIAVAGIAMGSIVFAPLVQFLLDAYPWRIAIRLFCLILLACTVPAALLVVDRPSDRGLHPDGAASDPSRDGRPRDSAPVSARTILTTPTFWLAAGAIAIVLSGLKGMVTNLAPLALDQGIRGRDAAFLISIYGLCGLFAKLTFATFADRFSPRVLMAISLFGFAAGMVVLAQTGLGYGALAGGVAMTGLFGGIMVPLQSLIVPRIFGREVVGRAMGLLSMVISCALLTSPPLFGLIFDLAGSYAGVFIAFAVVACLMAIGTRRIRLRPSM